MSDETFSDLARQAARTSWDAATGHRFVRDLAADAIPDPVFAHYLVLDYAFIEQLASLVGHAVAVAPDMPSKARLAGFLAVLTSEENDYFLRSFSAMGLPAPTREADVRHPVLDGFRGLIARQMGRNTWLDALSVLVPVEWVYLTWAKEAATISPQPSRFWLKEWIDLHVDDGFESFVNWMRAALDEAARNADPDARAHAAAAFAEALTLEVAFFDAAYEAT